MVVFLPDICNMIIRRAWRGLPAVVATARRSESSVDLEGPNGQALRIAYSDINSTNDPGSRVIEFSLRYSF